MIFFQAVQSILPIIIMIATGFYLTAKGWFNDDAAKLISKIVTIIALPTYMIWNLMGTFDRNELLGLSGGLVIPFISMALCYVLGVMAAKIFDIADNHQGMFITTYFCSNTIFIGLPVNLALFGEESVPYVLLYYIANTVTFWTIGVYGISRDGNPGEIRIMSLDTVKRVFSPALMGFIIAIILIGAGLKLPRFLLDTFRYLGSLTTPLSMIFIGISIYTVNRKTIVVNKDMIAVLIGRFIVCPATILLLAHFIPIPLLMKKVFVMQAAMPAMTQTAIIAKAYEADSGYAAVMTTVTTVLAAAVIPVYMMLV